jgi:dTDP-4-amino-4,6-dideoxy-D-galactose acyltransferase
MSDASPCRFLEWDSEFFGRRIATCTTSPRDRGEMAGVLAWCREHSIACLYALTPAGDVAAVQLMEDHAFRLVDVRTTYEAEVARELASARARELAGAGAHELASAGTHELAGPRARAPAIRNAREADVPALRAIAAASHTDSRFYADERFDRARCDELYATWIEKSCRGWADAVFVAEHDGRAAGYVTCHLRAARRGEIGLLGVAAAAHGRGLGRALVASALGWFAERDIERASVVTQARNVAAQRLYQSSGFRTSAVELWHHRWFTGSGARS